MLVLSCSSPCHTPSPLASRGALDLALPPAAAVQLSSPRGHSCRAVLYYLDVRSGHLRRRGAPLSSSRNGHGVLEHLCSCMHAARRPRRQHQLPAPVCHMPRSLSPRMPPVAGGGAATVRSLFIRPDRNQRGRPSVSRYTSRLSRPHLGVAAVGSRGSWRSGATGSG